ncbi:MAG: ATP synthase F1 subunit delta [Bacteroidales bacterium]|nr:ATP synthase F1 subunit delta [Bacteroidales bacterium]
MNTGMIASRYATALLGLVDETGSGEVALAQAQAILKALVEVPDLRRALEDRTGVSGDRKIALLETVVEGDGKGVSLAPELRQFAKLLVRNGRIGDIVLILKSFESEYYKSRGLVRGRLILSSPEDTLGEENEQRLRSLIEEKTGKKLILTTEIDESLIGGFRLEVEDRLLDASVSRQLDIIRRRFEEKNRRIV